MLLRSNFEGAELIMPIWGVHVGRKVLVQTTTGPAGGAEVLGCSYKNGAS